ncbi:hypothetical protein, partial [Pseudomonas sp. 2995-1]|uniref:hypothetical protein n=1 Tax=Pseudomonas sp. 2995-1 TaxID=1712679 RepID=UPI001C478684
LIMISLIEAIKLANPLKSFQFIINHRLDKLAPKLGEKVSASPDLIDQVTSYYLTYNEAAIVEDFLHTAVRHVPVSEQDTVEQ